MWFISIKETDSNHKKSWCLGKQIFGTYSVAVSILSSRMSCLLKYDRIKSIYSSFNEKLHHILQHIPMGTATIQQIEQW